MYLSHMRYEIVVEETLSRTLCLDAENEQQALDMAKQMYIKQLIVLGSEDFVQVEFNIPKGNDLVKE